MPASLFESARSFFDRARDGYDSLNPVSQLAIATAGASVVAIGLIAVVVGAPVLAAVAAAGASVAVLGGLALGAELLWRGAGTTIPGLVAGAAAGVAATATALALAVASPRDAERPYAVTGDYVAVGHASAGARVEGAREADGRVDCDITLPIGGVPDALSEDCSRATLEPPATTHGITGSLAIDVRK